MPFTQEQKRGAYKKLATEVQSFIMDNETTELIARSLKESGLTEEQSDLADTEILNSMYGLQTLSDAIGNIAKISGKNINDLSKLKTDLENNIFSKIPTSKNSQNTKLNANDVSKRVDELCKKYSLNSLQAVKLSELVLSAVTSGKNSSDILEPIISGLSISKLLAEQLVSDLESRIFEYGVNVSPNKAATVTAQQKLKPVTPPQYQPPVQPKPVINPVIKPQSTFVSTPIKPAAPASQVVKIIPVAPVNTLVQQNKIPEIRPNDLPMKEEVHQITVPRYIPNNTLVTPMTPPKPAFVQPVTQSAQQAQIQIPITEPIAPKPTVIQPAQKPAENTPSEKYNSDPYREPLG